ncbi:hypothetical protein HCU40_16745 [Pseudanabaena biceps]|nr:hypothetical protein [Pseudanabaena biceps]
MSIWQSPLVLPAQIFADMSEADIALEMELMFQRSSAISQAISGNMPIDELCELIRAQEISIDDWADDCDEYGEDW